MINRLEHRSVTWIDLEAPTADEISEVTSEFKLDPLIAQELSTPTAKPKVDVRPSFIYAVLHFPAFRHTHKSAADQEVDFVIGKKFIITTRYETVDPILDYQKSFEVAALTAKKDSALHGGHLFFEMMRRLYRFTENEMDDIDDRLSRIEEQIFAGREREMVAEISQASRKLLDVKRILSPHKTVLESFEIAGEKFFEEDFSHYARAIAAEHFRVFERASSSLDSVGQLRATNDSLVTTKQNETMKLLTLMTFITAPLMLFASLFGMNLRYMPFVQHENGFWIIVGFMTLIASGFFVFFKRKKWL